MEISVTPICVLLPVHVISQCTPRLIQQQNFRRYEALNLQLQNVSLFCMLVFQTVGLTKDSFYKTSDTFFHDAYYATALHVNTLYSKENISLVQ